jgi:hypothetical protein
VLKKLEAEREAAPGPITPLRCATGEPAVEYGPLMSATADLIAGEACSDGGNPPPGAQVFETLAMRGSDVLLGNVPRSPNPEARA